MSDYNKIIFSKNLNRLMNESGKSRKDISGALNVSYYTITDWVKGKKYPRMDKVEMLANYFGVQKSDLIEDKEEHKTPSSEDERVVVELFRQIPKEKQPVVLEMIRLALKTQE